MPTTAEKDAKKEAVQRMIDSFSYIPYGWLEHIQKATGELFSLPMWGTVWLAGDNKRSMEEIMKEYNMKDEDGLREMEGDENAGLIMDGWRELGDTGVWVREFEDELLIGINGAGYNFYESHWEPLYDALGYQWHLR